MRQSIKTWVLAGTFLAIGAMGFGEPIISGHQLANLKGNAGTSPLFLAHIYNTENAPLKAGSYEVGLELNGGQGKKIFILKPTAEIKMGRMATVRLPVKVSAEDLAGSFRVFIRANRKTTFSTPYSMGANAATPMGQMTPLYTEAPPEVGVMAPPKEIPFENDPVKFGDHSTKVAAKSATLPVIKRPLVVEKSAGKLPAAKPELATKPQTEKTKPMNPADFKTIRTIDEELVIYVVKSGDTLKSIAEGYYQNPAKEAAIAEFNFIERSSAVKVGEEIIVEVKPLKKETDSRKSVSPEKTGKNSPDKAVEGLQETAVPANGAKAGSGSVETASGGTYTIQPGDSLGKISKKFFGKATQASRILKLNPGLNPTNLKVGTTITIPDLAANNG